MTAPEQSETGNAREAWSSVELTRNAKGAYQWTIKLYVPAGTEDGIVDELANVDNHLRVLFAWKPAPEVIEP